MHENIKVVFPGTDVYEVVLEEVNGTHVRVVHALNGGRPTTFYLEKKYFELDPLTGLWTSSYSEPCMVYSMRRPASVLPRAKPQGWHGEHTGLSHTSISREDLIRSGPELQKTNFNKAPLAAPERRAGKYQVYFEKRGENGHSEKLTVEYAVSSAHAERQARTQLAAALNISERQAYMWFKLVRTEAL